MPDYFDYGHMLLVPVGFPINTANNEEQYDVDSSNHQNELWAGMTSSTGVQVHAQGYHPQAYGQPGGHLQTMGRYETPSPMDMQQNNRTQHGIPREYDPRADDSYPLGYIDPTLLLMPRPSHGQVPSSDVYSHQYHRARACPGQPTNPLAYAGVQQGGQCSELGIFSSGYDTVVPEKYDQLADMVYDAQTEPRYQCTMPGSFGAQSSIPIRGPDSLFIPGVLGRQEDHQAVLGMDTARLMQRLKAPSDNAHVHPVFDRSPITNSDSCSESMEDSHATIFPPQPLQVIQAQRPQGHGHVSQMTDKSLPRCSSLPRWFVERSTPEVVDPDVSDSRSGLTSDDRLHPDASSRVSDAPSPVHTDASTDILYCPFDECNAKFTGHYRKGNLGRHRRQKHAGQIVEYRCKDEYCSRVFQRKDARLKHYRKAHPYLNTGRAMSRNASSSTGSDWVYADHVTSPYAHRDGFDTGDVSSYGDVQSYQGYSSRLDLSEGGESQAMAG
ncbi:hypothetical protein BU25DRAFT_144976 [Macroventuria anomochaeta]|uniref:Uncharacterized protein n=1 Tax=Macroventuria anomochaeta TaxID=301207 RepID=A0ACB6SDK5_9PLEO|nr:uncharacterized protein BU25DRAFT_144976 [Macroventuria anomochaeta]KAF2632231.1 hypothetical protein BU25DRAFT_144976 [Macroventuria anomochaeta]